jgi:S-formylglutathione hydrolase FrmB
MTMGWWGGGVAASGARSTEAPISSFEVVATPSLAGNMLGDPAEIEIAIWLPASYASSSSRYPAVYFLAGFGESPSTAAIGAVLQDLVETGRAPEMILVGIGGVNSLGGSFYVDSPVTGNWAQAIRTDVVDWVDAHHRTLATPASRGIAGFSMGGFGALDLAMRHPDVFGSVCALSPGLFAPGGLEATEMFADDGVIAEFLELQRADIEAPMTFSGSTALHFTVAYGSAFAPNPAQDFPYVDYPFTEQGGPRDEPIWARWEAGFGGIDAELAAYDDNLRSLQGIALDYGTNDPYTWIPEGTRYLADRLSSYGIDVDVTNFAGGHGPVGPRAEAVMFPFFADVLATAS